MQPPMPDAAAAAGDGDVLRIEGTVADAYPLRKLEPQKPRAAAANAFTLGDGPCGDDAAHVMTITLETKGCDCHCYVCVLVVCTPMI